MHINPDHFLETAEGRVFTQDLNNAAWRDSYRAFHQALAAAESGTHVYVLIGAQGSGKSAWARDRARTEPNAIIFDAILVRYRERVPLIAAAQAHGMKAIAVWFKTPLAVCLARNGARPAGEVVSEQALRNVFAAIEPPHQSEGFECVMEVHAHPAHVAHSLPKTDFHQPHKKPS